MIRRNSFTVALGVLMLMAVVSSPALGVLVLKHNFNDIDTSLGGVPLTGQTAETGQVWETLFFADSSLTVDPNFGFAGTNGAGSVAIGTGNQIPLGQTLSTGVYLLSLDFVNPGIHNEPQFWLRDTVNNSSPSLSWRGDTSLNFEGMSIPAFSTPVGFGANGGTLHLDLGVDLDAKIFQFHWHNANDPGNLAHSGSSAVIPYTVNFAPNEFWIFRNAANANFTSGFDNIQIIPEPATMALLGLGGLVMLRRRR